MPPGSVTIDDVAARAGVSIATASRALRGLPNVASATRLRVAEAARTLHYHPDPHASRLVTGRTATIGMAVPHLNSWYFTQLMAGVEAVLQVAGYDLLLYTVTGEDARRRFLSEAKPFRKRVDGLILADLVLPQQEAEDLSALGVRIVTIGERAAGHSSVEVDNRTAAREAVRHLTNLGHRRIGLLGAPDPARPEERVSTRRLAGYRDVLAERGLDLQPHLEVACSNSIEGGAQAATTLLGRADLPTAVFALCDEIAFGVLKTLREVGLRVPEDLSVIGFDDHDLASVLGLTTVSQSVVGQGASAARLLLQAVTGGGDGPTRQVCPTRLVVRSSTGRLSPAA